MNDFKLTGLNLYTDFTDKFIKKIHRNHKKFMYYNCKISLLFIETEEKVEHVCETELSRRSRHQLDVQINPPLHASTPTIYPVSF